MAFQLFAVYSPQVLDSKKDHLCFLKGLHSTQYHIKLLNKYLLNHMGFKLGQIWAEATAALLQEELSTGVKATPGG